MNSSAKNEKAGGYLVRNRVMPQQYYQHFYFLQ